MSSSSRKNLTVLQYCKNAKCAMALSEWHMPRMGINEPAIWWIAVQTSTTFDLCQILHTCNRLKQNWREICVRGHSFGHPFLRRVAYKERESGRGQILKTSFFCRWFSPSILVSWTKLFEGGGRGRRKSRWFWTKNALNRWVYFRQPCRLRRLVCYLFVEPFINRSISALKVFSFFFFFF